MWFVAVSMVLLSSLSDPIFWLFVAATAFVASRYEFHWAFALSIAGGLYCYLVRPSIWHAVMAWLFLYATSAIVVALVDYSRQRKRHGTIGQSALQVRLSNGAGDKS
jgi:hypothetical protein